jgi:hypothetical protein
MKLYYLFSRNEKIGSKLISWASGLLVKDLEKVPSHVAILLEFEGISEQFVIESVLESGVRIIPLSVWLQRNELCYKIFCGKERTLDDIFKIVNSIWGKKYDWLGISFFALCFIKHLLFKTPFPKENAWQQEDHFFCSEAAGKISGYEKTGMATPAKMCSDFIKLASSDL